VAEFKDGKGIRIRTYLDPNEALEAAGLRGIGRGNLRPPTTFRNVRPRADEWLNGCPAIPVCQSEMTDQEIRQFVEKLAVPEPISPPPCPLCGLAHRLETRCETARFEAGALRQ